PTLVIRDTHSTITNLFSKDAIFLHEVVNDVLLMLLHPAGKGDHEKRKRDRTSHALPQAITPWTYPAFLMISITSNFCTVRVRIYGMDGYMGICDNSRFVGSLKIRTLRMWCWKWSENLLKGDGSRTQRRLASKTAGECDLRNAWRYSGCSKTR